jgi:hypothetical protein
MVHHHQNGIIKTKRWEICDEIHGNSKPQGCRDQYWLKETMRVMMRILCSSTNIATLDKLLHILPKLWPSIISKH